MWLIVGLGNPEKKYEHTRHNAGWLVLEQLRADENFPDFKTDVGHDCEISSGSIDGHKVLLVKPTTYMNESGRAVQSVAAFYKITPDHLIVVHDDLDFPLSTVKTQFDRSAAGHNGVTSVIERLGTQAFHRVRIGIGPEVGDGADFVLQKFSPAERELLEPALDSAGAAVRKLVQEKD